MHFSVLPPWAAPISTGHPFGLPGTSDQTKSVTRVPTVSKQSSSDSGMMQEKSPSQFWRVVGGQPDPATHVAPPSIMQLKISALLEQQAPLLQDTAEEREKDADEVRRDAGAEETESEVQFEEARPDAPQTPSSSGYGQLSEMAQDAGAKIEGITA
ncbi:hypothetical protein P775_18825 [Puniceibacterium antarcticum]|uniref:Uncharacterized protein n=1 Tax=Puniceibacterium antarcticum TaxID=1206336 RepID=A0A2G8RAN5_9RHOB|nr:hypothetical protein [Puniceibacterium antarcticum]PIL18626.1 hypothetical protein P775_18825 [Puniceibacterium antarcticum]